ncbi:MAG TPA: twin-arginine translocase TatA/TatE family subunit [Candidatus Marinimicrobia bacterium]|nr:twin-arginine translocase TatA/TatE family subunit [Candidatus Neomarinimicrobiota bacterium]HJM83992.1 twin-arginine translocase TatA/TatE family subunit [Candidatus Neomarinimicrobiota bacterium]
MMGLGPWEIGLIIIVIIILFGGKKLPELARGLGLGLREFKKATREIKDEVKSVADDVEDVEKEIKE